VGETARGLSPQYQCEKEGGEEGAQKHEDRRRVAESEVDLAKHHILVDVGGEGVEVLIPQHHKEVEDSEGIEKPQEQDDQEHGSQERQGNAEESLQRVGAVDACGLVDVFGDGPEPGEE